MLRQYQRRFRYILVDEYQDTNVAQYLWLRLLSQAPTPSEAFDLAPSAGRGREHLESGVRGRVRSADPNSRISSPSPGPVICSRSAERRAERRRPPQKHLLRGRRRPVDLWLARRGGRQHPALRARFSRRQGHPPRAQLPLDRPHPRRRLLSHRAQRRPARQDAAHRGCRRREGHRDRRLGFGRGSPRHRRGDRGPAARRREAERDRDSRPRLLPDARVRRPLRHARPALSRDRRSADSTSAPKSATRWLICA